MKRTTLTLDEQIFAAIRKRAAAEGRTFKEVVNELLRQALAQADRPDTGYKLRWRPVRGQGTQPGVNLDDRDALVDLMEGR